MARTLTSKQAAYRDARVSGLGKSEAYRTAYDASRMSPAAIAVEANKLDNHPVITLSIAQSLSEAVAVVEERRQEAVLTAARVAEEAARIAFGDIRDLVTWDSGSVTLHDSDSLTPAQAALVKEVRVQKTTTTTKDGSEVVNETREVKVWDKLSALALLSKMFPEFSEKHEFKGELRALVVTGRLRG